jgi:ABC-2 type transport system permease protein
MSTARSTIAGRLAFSRPAATPFLALARQTMRDARTRTIAFALLFFYASAAQVLTYRSAYPTLHDRMELARSFGANKAVRLLYGVPHDLLTVGGWAAWRLGALTIFAGLWGIFAAVRAMRTEEESGRAELVLSGPVTRGTAFRAGVAGIAAGAAILWVALFLGLLTGRPGVGGSAYLALALLSPMPVFAGVGALASQIAPTRRGAVAIGSGVLAVALLLRIAADTSSAGWLRWVTPLGWAENLRPFADPQPLVLLLAVIATAVLLVAAARIAAWRDVGAGLLPAHDSAPPRLWLLSSPTALALRMLLGGMVAWLVGIAAVAALLGVISDSVVSGLSQSLQDQLAKLGTSPNSPSGFIGFSFLFVLLAMCLFACFQLAAIRDDESEQRLETLFALPVRRGRWLAGRLALVAGAAAAISLAAGVVTWVGAVSQGVDLSLARMLEAGANCLPATLLFLGLGALGLVLVPRAGALIAYALVGVTFLWQTIGGVADLPGWALGLSPFHHVGLVPAEAFRATGALVMLAIAAVAALAATWLFDRRDLVGP